MFASVVALPPASPLFRPVSAGALLAAPVLEPGLSPDVWAASPDWTPFASAPAWSPVSCDPAAALEGSSTGGGGLTVGATGPCTHASTYAIQRSTMPRPTVAPKTKNSAAVRSDSSATRLQPRPCCP